jgi:dolichol-phosphate mannosyltransferase
MDRLRDWVMVINRVTRAGSNKERLERFLVIIPTYNEVQSVPVVVTQLLDVYSQIDILVVDDNSPDGTADAIYSLRNNFYGDRLFIISNEYKLGLGPAYISGIRWSLERNYAFSVEMDADGSHRPKDLFNLLKQVEVNPEIDLVIGSRWIPGGSVENWPLYREWLSRLANLYSRLILGVRVHDMTSGFRIFRNSIFELIDLSEVKSHGFSFQIEMTLLVSNLGKNISEVPISFLERESGVSKMNYKIIFEAITRVTVWGIKKRLADYRTIE